MKNMTMEVCRQSRITSFMRDHSNEAINYAMGLARNREVAQDMVQDAICKVLTNGNYYDPKRPLKPLLYTIMRNRFFDQHKRIRLHRKFVQSERPEIRVGVRPGACCDTKNEVEIGALRSEAVNAVRDALATLRPNHKNVLVLRDIEGSRYGEVARKLGIPVGTVRSRVHRARKALRQRLESWEQS